MTIQYGFSRVIFRFVSFCRKRPVNVAGCVFVLQIGAKLLKFFSHFIKEIFAAEEEFFISAG